jgi:hypothetical protein
MNLPAPNQVPSRNPTSDSVPVILSTPHGTSSASISTTIALNSVKRQIGKVHLALDIELSTPPNVSAPPSGEELCWVPRDYFAVSLVEYSKKRNAQGGPYTENDHAYALITKAGKEPTPLFTSKVVSALNTLKSAFGKDVSERMRAEFFRHITTWMIAQACAPTITIGQTSDVIAEIKQRPLSDDSLETIAVHIWNNLVFKGSSPRTALQSEMMEQYGFRYQPTGSKGLGCFQRLISAKYSYCKRPFDQILADRNKERTAQLASLVPSNTAAEVSSTVLSSGAPVDSPPTKIPPSYQNLPLLNNEAASTLATSPPLPLAKPHSDPALHCLQQLTKNGFAFTQQQRDVFLREFKPSGKCAPHLYYLIMLPSPTTNHFFEVENDSNIVAGALPTVQSSATEGGGTSSNRNQTTLVPSVESEVQVQNSSNPAAGALPTVHSSTTEGGGTSSNWNPATLVPTVLSEVPLQPVKRVMNDQTHMDHLTSNSNHSMSSDSTADGSTTVSEVSIPIRVPKKVPKTSTKPTGVCKANESNLQNKESRNDQQAASIVTTPTTVSKVSLTVPETEKEPKSIAKLTGAGKPKSKRQKKESSKHPLAAAKVTPHNILCQHSVYDDSSFEQICAVGYQFMNKATPLKKCDECSNKYKPSNTKPIWYCKICRDYRVCNQCWNTHSLKANGRGRKRARRSVTDA